MGDGNGGVDYPDLLFEGITVEGLKKLEPLPADKKKAGKIRFGHEYQSWPPERKIAYLEKLASAMNHAADVMQQERNKCLEVIAHQEKQLKENTKQYLEQGELMHRELGAANQHQQELNTVIVQLQGEIKELKSKLKSTGVQ